MFERHAGASARINAPRGEAEPSDSRRFCAAGSLPGRTGRRRGGGARNNLPNAVPALGRDIRCAAEREPDGTHGLAGLDRLLGRAAADLFEDEVSREHTAVRVPVLIRDGQPEFTQSHRLKLGENRRQEEHRRKIAPAASDKQSVPGASQQLGSKTSGAANLRCIRRPGRPEQCLGWARAPR